jgi:hypothetical protein
MAEAIKEPLPACVGCGQQTILVDAADKPWCQSCDDKSKQIPPYPFTTRAPQGRHH